MQFHGWQNRHDTSLGDVMLQVGQHLAVLKAAIYLEKKGYSDDITVATEEATARGFNGDWQSAGLTKAESDSLLAEYLDAVVKVRGGESLQDLPNVRPELEQLVRRAYERADQVYDRGGSSPAPEEGAGLSGQVDPGERGQRGDSVRAGKDAGGAQNADREGNTRELRSHEVASSDSSDAETTDQNPKD